MSTRPAILLFVAAIAGVPLAAQPRLTRQDADHFKAKLSQIVQFGSAAPLRSAQPRATAVTDAEVNSYLRYLAGADVPAGIVEPVINAVGNGRVSGSAIVDLDAVRKQKARGWLDPLAYLSGRVPVTAAGTLTTRAGHGQFQLESAEIAGVTVPKAVLQELLTHYSRTVENPQGINMDEPFELPARIREIRVGAGVATVVQ